MSDYKEIKQQLEEERKKGSFLFLPSPIMDQSNSYYQPIIEIVRLREDEVYSAQKKYRIHYNGLLRLALASAMEWSAIDTCRTDLMNDRLYCSFRAVGGVRKADGKIYFHKAEKDIDLEITEMELTDQYTNSWKKGDKRKWPHKDYQNESEYVGAMVRRDIIQKRKNKLMLVESGAKARVIRFVLGLQSQYSNKNDVLGINFVMVHYALNPNHPDVRKALMGSMSDSQHMIYGGVKDTGQIAHIEHNNNEVIDIPVDEPEPESKPDVSKFKPGKNNENSNLIDFQNIPVEEQVKVLKTMCNDCGQDFDHYDKQAKGGIVKAEQQWRDDFFGWLKEEKEKQ